MGEANEARRRSSGMEHLSLQIDTYSRDLLQRFTSSNTQKSDFGAPNEENEASEEIELNLGLSLGGRFGVDKNAKKLIRSSSIAGSIPLIRDDDATTLTPISPPALKRTSSLPTETEEEWRKRKKLQTLRRMEAKRRRSEKQRNSNTNTILNPKTEREAGGVCSEEERREIEGSLGVNVRDNQYMVTANRFGSPVGLHFGLPSWAAAARQVVGGGGIDAVAKMKGGFMGGAGSGLLGFVQLNSQGSVESQGGSSSGMSEFESIPVQGSSSGGEARSPGSNQSLHDLSNQDAMVSSGTKTNENTCRTSGAMESPSKRPDSTENRGKEIGTNAMEDMPCVFTKGDGPNGRRIEGILYKYGKGEEVRIMCVCHGNFLSPAEFVKHAGGGDVAHPLRHIVVNPSSTNFS